MSFVNSAVKDAKEQTVVPEAEYDLRIQMADVKEAKSSGTDYVSVMIIIEDGDYPNAAPINHGLYLVQDKDEQTAKEYKLRMQRRFLSLFEIPFEDNGFDTDDFAGQTAKCLVVQEEITKDDGKGGRIGTGEYRNALRLPKFANEGEEAKETKPAGGRRARK